MTAITYRCSVLAVASILLLASLALVGFVNPNFTPIHLSNQSAHIMLFTYEQPDEDATELKLTFVETLKGDRQQLTSIDISNVDPEMFEHELLTAKGENPKPLALVFFSADADEGGSLHLGRYWSTLKQDADGNWAVDEWSDGHLLGVWDGGTDQLARVVRYIVTNPDPQVPSLSGAEWDGHAIAGTVPGAVAGAEMVDLGGEHGLVMFVASDAGDALLRWDDAEESFVAVEAGWQLSSQAVAWGDFVGDERLHGVALTADGLIFAQQDDGGSFTAHAISIAEASGVSHLATIPGTDAARLAISAEAGVLLARRSGDAWESDGALPLADGVSIEGPGRLLVGDINANGLVDLLLVDPAGGILFAAEEGGGFAAGARLEGASGPGEMRFARLADLDNTGLLDVIAVGRGGIRIWHNQGEATFLTRQDYAGEVRYIPSAAVRDIFIADFNNDGRPDLCLFNPGMGPHLFYGRGFMVFGFAEDLVGDDLADEIYQGQQAGLMVDLNGNGAQEMVSILEDGSILVMKRNTDDYMTMGVSLRLAADAAAQGPIMVSGGDEDRDNYGSLVLRPGGELFIGRSEPGPMFVRWQFPGGQAQEEMLILEQGTEVLYLGVEGRQ